MSQPTVKPLSRVDREALVAQIRRNLAEDPCDIPTWSEKHFLRYEATVRQLEEALERIAGEDRLHECLFIARRALQDHK